MVNRRLTGLLGRQLGVRRAQCVPSKAQHAPVWMSSAPAPVLCSTRPCAHGAQGGPAPHPCRTPQRPRASARESPGDRRTAGRAAPLNTAILPAPAVPIAS